MENLIRCDYTNHLTFLKLVLFYTFIVIINIITISNPLGIVLTILQYALVFIHIFKGRVRNAILYHMTFIGTSLSVTGLLGMFDDISASMLYNYASIKLVGPLSASYVMSILLAFICFSQHQIISKRNLYYKAFKCFLIIAIVGIIVGLFGMMYDSHYKFSGVLVPFIYMFVVLINMYILLCNYKQEMIRAVYYLSIVVIVAGVAGSFFTSIVLGIGTVYSTIDIYYTADIIFFAPLLLLMILYEAEKGIIGIALFLFFYLSLNTIGGKTVAAICLVALYILFLLFFNKDFRAIHNKHITMMRTFAAILVIGATSVSVSSDTLSFQKIHQFSSMFLGSVDDMDMSPYIRIASLFNVIDNGLTNPLKLIFGSGYGGYFTDSSGMLSNIPNLSELKAFPDEDINSGYFHSGHDTLVTVPFYNGLLGVFLFVKLAYSYSKRVKDNFLSFTAILWIILMFYFNTIDAVIGLFCLFGAEYNRKNDKRVSSDKFIQFHGEHIQQ